MINWLDSILNFWGWNTSCWKNIPGSSFCRKLMFSHHFCLCTISTSSYWHSRWVKILVTPSRSHARMSFFSIPKAYFFHGVKLVDLFEREILASCPKGTPPGPTSLLSIILSQNLETHICLVQTLHPSFRFIISCSALVSFKDCFFGGLAVEHHAHFDLQTVLASALYILLCCVGFFIRTA